MVKVKRVTGEHLNQAALIRLAIALAQPVNSNSQFNRTAESFGQSIDLSVLLVRPSYLVEHPILLDNLSC
jgi:hypothetical protein